MKTLKKYLDKYGIEYIAGEYDVKIELDKYSVKVFDMDKTIETIIYNKETKESDNYVMFNDDNYYRSIALNINGLKGNREKRSIALMKTLMESSQRYIKELSELTTDVSMDEIREMMDIVGSNSYDPLYDDALAITVALLNAGYRKVGDI